MKMLILKHLGESDLLQFQLKVQLCFCLFFFFFNLISISEMYILLTVRRDKELVPNYFEKYASIKVASLQEIWHIQSPQ